jgi:signal transduction histidine kinase
MSAHIFLGPTCPGDGEPSFRTFATVLSQAVLEASTVKTLSPVRPPEPLQRSAQTRHPSSLAPALDQICELAARLLRVPAAVVTLRLEDRPFVVASHGLADRARLWGATPLSLGLGEHSAIAGEPLAIHDVTRHALLANDPLHVQEGFTAYLALPVLAGSGVPGTLCALSREPRAWSRRDERDLALVGTVVERELELLDLKKLEQSRNQALDDLERVTHLLSSERTTLEEQARELQKYAFALLRSNRELDQFAYVASHDLKAPLRGIANIAQWLGEDLQDRLDGETRQYLALLQSRVLRMEGLVNGILEYARAGRDQAKLETVDVAALLGGVIDMLEPPDHFNVRVDGYMPVLVTERAPLERVFLNLIGNALAHADGDAPEVTVSVTDEGGGWCEFSVADNGPGIAPEHHARIFTIFQTLVSKDERESTGIGLAIVKRIVEWRGGQVWVESDVGRGATFRFLWPETPGHGKEVGAWGIAR